MKELCAEHLCTSCKACLAVCPINCIQIIYTPEGEERFRIDSNRCLKCGKCANVCQGLNLPAFHSVNVCLAARTKDESIYNNSSSGGIATLLSNIILKKNGVVYGAANFGEITEHIRVDEKKLLDSLSGSKYVRSNMEHVFKLIGQDLRNEKNILFIGTPCQVAAIKKLYGDKENLYTIDLICHGTPPTRQWEDHLKELFGASFFKKNIDKKVEFRKKDYVLKVILEKQTIYEKKWFRDTYYSAFMYGLNFYEKCYNCPYAQEKRVGDITVGDFWGLDKATVKKELKNSNYISLVLLNTEKGKQLWGEGSKYVYSQERKLDEAIEGNTQLRHPTIRVKDRDKFLNIYSGINFSYAVKHTFIKHIMIKEAIKEILKIPYRIVRDLIGG